ncbi:MAG: porphobilinogen synthase [Planctomycetes bacterium]|nr:porphobilinogen synthase [Planctomycetota bacterium]
MSSFPDTRLRRLRRTRGIRGMLGTNVPGFEKFLWPVFVVEGRGKSIPIPSMPDQNRMSPDRLCAALEPLVAGGLGGILLFGIVEDRRKDSQGTYACHEKGPVQRAAREVRRRFPELVIFTDVCLCAYTNHGHCGPLAKDGSVDNDTAIERLAEAAVSHAAAGADGVAPSAMMDGQVQAIRRSLRDAGFDDRLIMSYSTKFSSSMYGPFREAAGSAPAHGDRRQYQAPFNDIRQALRESQMDAQEGADILMVKPALFYLDVIAIIRNETNLPLAAYNVSGEYAMLIAAAERGWLDLEGTVRESLAAIGRAGADIIISYWASQYTRFFRKIKS